MRVFKTLGGRGDDIIAKDKLIAIVIFYVTIKSYTWFKFKSCSEEDEDEENEDQEAYYETRRDEHRAATETATTTTTARDDDEYNQFSPYRIDR